jgi:hypothetical protein
MCLVARIILFMYEMVQSNYDLDDVWLGEMYRFIQHETIPVD